MADYIIKGATLTAIADSIRAKTGTTDKIAPTDMPTAIEGIQGGGGGSADDRVKYVTFMNNGVELITYPVIVGDTCKDPYASNLIAVPTKDSTAQYDYTFNGWALTDGGSANSNALKNVTEDRTVYAAFNATARKYTITWLDEDGSTLKTEQVAYGTVPSYTPTKDGAFFNAWAPTPVAVTGDASYTASWRSVTVVIDTTTCTVSSYTCSAYIPSIKLGINKGNKYIVELDGVSYECDGLHVRYQFNGTTSNSNCFMGLGNPYKKVWNNGATTISKVVDYYKQTTTIADNGLPFWAEFGTPEYPEFSLYATTGTHTIKVVKLP